VIPVAHTNGFGWDELVVFATILVALWVYRKVRGPIDDDVEPKPGGPNVPPREGGA
jgi:hypothetical protein